MPLCLASCSHAAAIRNRRWLASGDEAVPVARVLVDLVVVDPVLVEPVLVDPVVPSIQRSSCAARVELREGFTHVETELGLSATCGAAET